jgi:hypothetical protein
MLVERENACHMHVTRISRKNSTFAAHVLATRMHANVRAKENTFNELQNSPGTSAASSFCTI